ncbi:hypothetical protein AVEN_193345-1 [Araneus ventricosus]|uniref:Uncharacterized protein n=1 Tax=Araneus ventricosus TaxID=182803 RepID=A0A4Y2ETF6_ARAVE|nr:hypothetical protein AVEN_193345-1 [Araneus ventricosus]
MSHSISPLNLNRKLQNKTRILNPLLAAVCKRDETGHNNSFLEFRGGEALRVALRMKKEIFTRKRKIKAVEHKHAFLAKWVGETQSTKERHQEPVPHGKRPLEKDGLEGRVS